MKDSPTFSYDGRFRAFISGAGPDDNHVEIIDSDSGDTVEFSGSSGLWSPTANLYAYSTRNLANPAAGTIHLGNLDEGTDEELLGGSVLHSWSPDGRYVVVYVDDGLDDFVVVDVTDRQHHVRFSGAWPRGWLSDGSLLYTRNICGDFDLYGIGPDGTNDRAVVTGEPGAGLTAFVSPDGQRIAYRTFGEHAIFGVHAVDGSESIRVDPGDYSLPYGPSLGPANWSPDGRYVVLSTIPGKDGLCMTDNGPRPTTIEVLP